MNVIDLGIIALYIIGCTSLGAWLGAGEKGLKGYFLGESNIPAWAVMVAVSTEGKSSEKPTRLVELMSCVEMFSRW